MLAGLKNLAQEIFTPDKDLSKEISLKYGEKIANCKCKETIPMIGRCCDYCQFEQIKDFNFVQNYLDMVGE